MTRELTRGPLGGRWIQKEPPECIHPDCIITTKFGPACEHSCPHEKFRPYGAQAMTRDAHEIEREGMFSDMLTLRAEKRELRAEVEQLKAAIAYVRQRSQLVCEILNEFDNTRPKP
jgi:hypothetical protein